MIDTSIDILAAKIELAERSGNAERLAALRREQASRQAAAPEAKPAVDDDADMDTNVIDAEVDAEVDTECFTTALGAFAPKIKRALVTYGIYDLDSLAEWDFHRLSLIPSLSRRDVVQVFATMNALQLGYIIGSAGDIETELPPKDPFAVDYLAGRTPADCDEFINMLADGVPQREVSRRMGSAFGWHQRAQSLADRHSLTLCQRVADAFRLTYRGKAWWRAVSIEQTPDRERRHWRLRIELRCTVPEGVKTCGAAENRKRGGYSWHSADVVFVEGK